MNDNQPDATTAHRDTPEQRVLRLRVHKESSNGFVIAAGAFCAPSILHGAMLIGVATGSGMVFPKLIGLAVQIVFFRLSVFTALLWLISKRRSLPRWWPNWLRSPKRAPRPVKGWHAPLIKVYFIGLALLLMAFFIGVLGRHIQPGAAVGCFLGAGAFFASIFWRWGDTIHCARCGYEQGEGAPELCPECGSDWYDPLDGARMGTRRFDPALFFVGLVLMIGAVGVAIIGGRNGP